MPSAIRAVLCAVCGQRFKSAHPKAKYCSRSCKLSHAPGCAPSRNLGALRSKRVRVAPSPRECIVCSTAFEALGKQKRCGLCRDNNWVAKTACGGCGSMFFARPNQIFCSRPCIPATVAIGERPCPRCGEPTTSGSNAFCPPCKKAARRDNNRRKNVKRRGGPQPSRRISIHEVCQRDGWRCHLCGKRVSDRYASPHPLSATLDHLIPLADGGSDEPENLALAHRDCNTRRNTGGTVQLLLFG